MKNINVEKRYLEARQTSSQTVSSFTAYLDQLKLQLPLPISKPQPAKNLLYRLWPNINQEILPLADIPTRHFELESLAICIEKTTRNNHCQPGPPEPTTHGRGKAQLLFCNCATNSATIAAQVDLQATLPAGWECGGLIKCYNCNMPGHILRNCRSELNSIPTAVCIMEVISKGSTQ